MEPKRAILHLSTAERSASADVSAWAEACGDAEVMVCGDAFDACVQALQPSASYDLIFVGTDRLAVDEFVVVRYLRESFPKAVLILYGQDAGLVEYSVMPLTAVYRSRAALGELLARGGVDSVVEHIRHLSFGAVRLAGPRSAAREHSPGALAPTDAALRPSASEPRPSPPEELVARPLAEPRLLAPDAANSLAEAGAAHAPAPEEEDPRDWIALEPPAAPAAARPALNDAAAKHSRPAAASANAHDHTREGAGNPPRAILSQEELEALLKDTGI